MYNVGQQRSKKDMHPYLAGNFAPIKQTTPLTLCTHTGSIPKELLGGQYVRNGGNPVSHEDLGQDAHWFDGDGMLSGVAFQPSPDGTAIVPRFVNQYILTDLYISKRTTATSSAIMPSITTLIHPLYSLFWITLCIFRTLFLVFLSHLPGSQQAIRRISVANTSIFYHDGRALAGCESGPPIRIQLPSLDTVGWYDGHEAEGESANSGLIQRVDQPFGGDGLLSFLQEWTTGHPKVDPISGEMLLYHNTFIAPYIHYSVIPSDRNDSSETRRIVNKPVAGVSGAKMMHDFGVSRSHTLIMDLPLTLDPFNLFRNKQVVSYDPSQSSRFGIFNRYTPSEVRWFSTLSCCIFHTANMWDSGTSSTSSHVQSVNLLACRMISAAMVYNAGNIAPPLVKTRKGGSKEDMSPNTEICGYEKAPAMESTPLLSEPSGAEYKSCSDAVNEEEQCRLYYYEFDLSTSENKISYQWSLSTIPFEFPTVRPSYEMQAARYVYGCSTSTSSFSAALGRATKIDVLAKMDSKALIEKGKQMGLDPVTGCVDTRTVDEILVDQANESPGNDRLSDSIQLFKLPPNHFAQEPRFVPKSVSRSLTSPQCSDDPDAEDTGYLLFYVFDESQLLPNGECPSNSTSELWILDAQNMRDIIAKIQLPQRVPYGLHGTWFSPRDVENQRGVENLRSLEDAERRKEEWTQQGSAVRRLWMKARDRMERLMG